MLDIPVNARVQCVDGPCGKSTHVIVNPTNYKATHFVVEDKDFPDSSDRLVPVERIASTTHNLISLDCTRDDVAEMDPFVTTRYVTKVVPSYPASYYGGDPFVLEAPYVYAQPETFVLSEERVPPGELAVYRGTSVEATDGRVGEVGELVVDPASEEITHLVLREGHLWGKKDVVLPLSAIDHIAGDSVYLKLDKEAIKLLPAIPVRRSFGWEDAEIELVAWVFKETDKAEEALQSLKQLKREDHIIVAIRNFAVLVKDEDGKVSIKEAKDLDAKHGELFGAITGGLIGLVAGPVGAVVGAAAGAVTGGVAAEWIDMGFSDKYLKDLEKYLQPGTSALIALIESEWAGKVVDELAAFEGQLFRQALTDEIVAELMDEAKAGGDDTE